MVKLMMIYGFFAGGRLRKLLQYMELRHSCFEWIDFFEKIKGTKLKSEFIKYI